MLPIKKIIGKSHLSKYDVSKCDALRFFSLVLFRRSKYVMRNAQVDMLYFIHNLYYGARTDVLRITCQNYELLNHFELTRALSTMQIVF